MWIIWNLGYAYSFMLILDEHGFSTLQSRERSWLALHRHMCCITYIYIHIKITPNAGTFFSTLSTQLATYPPVTHENPWQVHRPLSGSVFFCRNAAGFGVRESHNNRLHIYIYIYTYIHLLEDSPSWTLDPTRFQVRNRGFREFYPGVWGFFSKGVFNPYLIDGFIGGEPSAKIWHHIYTYRVYIYIYIHTHIYVHIAPSLFRIWDLMERMKPLLPKTLAPCSFEFERTCAHPSLCTPWNGILSFGIHP